jgi:hypothetical protein
LPGDQTGFLLTGLAVFVDEVLRHRWGGGSGGRSDKGNGKDEVLHFRISFRVLAVGHDTRGPIGMKPI